jgi:hypothetical protein
METKGVGERHWEAEVGLAALGWQRFVVRRAAEGRGSM